MTLATAGRTAVVTLNDPTRLNALTVPMAAALSAALAVVDYSVVNALVLTGAGRAFSAGGDFKFLAERAAATPPHNAATMRAFYASFLGAMRRVPVPTLAALNGPAIGAGACLALTCDLRVTSATAKIGFTFTGLGLHPGMGATYLLPRLVGHQQAARLLLSSEVISGEEAARIGLVLHATPDDAGVLPYTMGLAARIAAQAPVATRGTVRTLRTQCDAGIDAALWAEADAQAQCYAGADFAEGLAAVVAKRPPVWGQY